MKKEKISGIIGGVIAAIIISVIFVQMSSTEESNDIVLKIIPPNGTDYVTAPRDWPTSGPFQIDRSQYVLGELVLMRIGDLQPNEKGQIAFLQPTNGTHQTVYITIPFDGSQKITFNQYFKPALSMVRGICSKADLLGNWTVVFQGTDYNNLKFEIVDRYIPGEEENYEEPVC
ncbi:MAG: hypothetical protein IH842_02125 [Thaumarchaeota archaeon]|nr:hypothetical protein [Nitrososphaerota archaeon]